MYLEALSHSDLARHTDTGGGGHEMEEEEKLGKATGFDSVILWLDIWLSTTSSDWNELPYGWLYSMDSEEELHIAGEDGSTLARGNAEDAGEEDATLLLSLAGLPSQGGIFSLDRSA